MDCALDLYAAGISGWAGDLAHALADLPIPVTLPSVIALRAPGMVDDIILQGDATLRAQPRQDIETSSRLYLMKDRMEPQKKGPPRKTLTQFRH